MDSYTPPKITYRYLDWCSEHGAKILTHQIVYFAEPSKLNDPYDCALIFDYAHLSDADLRHRIHAGLLRDGLSNAQQEKLVEAGFIRTRSSGFDDHMQEVVREQVEARYGVFSTSEKWDKLPMWAYYADSHRGFCVGIDTILFRKFLDARFRGVTHVRVDPVTYTNDARIHVTKDHSADEQMKLITTKSDVWLGEEEIRFTLVRDRNDEPFKPKDRTIAIPAEVISEVYLGWHANQFVKSDIKKILRTFLPHAKLFEIKPTSGEFRLARLATR